MNLKVTTHSGEMFIIEVNGTVYQVRDTTSYLKEVVLGKRVIWPTLEMPFLIILNKHDSLQCSLVKTIETVKAYK